MRVLTISVTEPGRRMAERLPYEHVHGKPVAALSARWRDVDAFVMILALGATVRLIAPLLGDKESDPAVVCVDDSGSFAISVCGGHAGGGNDLTQEVARLLGAEPVITTATDRLEVPALDQLVGFRAEGDLAGVTAALLADQPVAIDRNLEWPLPRPLIDRLDPNRSGDRPVARIVVDDRALPEGPAGLPLVALRPPSLVVGIGTTTNASAGDAGDAVEAVLSAAGLSPHSIAALATIDRRAEHPSVAAVAQRWHVPVHAFSAETLDAIDVPTPSDVVAGAVGTRSVAEAAALAAAGAGSALVVTKVVASRVTVAVARRVGPPGSLTVVGLGPGSVAQRTPEAARAVRHAEVVVGLQSYVEQCADLLTPAHDVRPFPIGAEIERVRLALDLAAEGRRVALVCSGDAGVYAMASPALELAGSERYRDLEVSVVPGVTAGLAAAALLGAPLGHDHLVVSLSDLLTPWEVIEARVRAAAEHDLVLVVYNPRSTRRTWQIEKARSLLLEHRAPETPVGVVTDAARPGQRVTLTTLGGLDCDSVNMTTCLVIGSSSTRVVAGAMVTPRGYRG
jgi:cobalt-precorrin 5A hydrolase/precorrin-3B C17-methyltransferase